MKNQRKWIFDVLFLVLVMGLTVYGLFHSRDLGQLKELLGSANWRWWLAGLAMVVLFILGESLVLHDVMRTLHTPHRLTHCFLYSFIGFFFSCITPSAGGGQPAQVYFMKKDGISAAVTVPVLMLVTITYKLVLVCYGLAVFLIRPPEIMAALEPVMGWCYLGLGLNVAFVSLYLLLVFCPRIVERFLMMCIRGLEHIRPRGKQQKRMENLEHWMRKYRDVARCFQHHWGMILRVMVLTVLQRSILFAVTWMTMRSFGLSETGLVTVMALQAMISMGTDLLPLPGGMGASETMFMQIFPAVCGSKLTLPVLMVSRGISYYGQLLISAGFTGAAAFCLGTHKREEEEK